MNSSEIRSSLHGLRKQLILLDDSINTDSDLAKQIVNTFDVHLLMLINRIEKDELEERFMEIRKEEEQENE
jgi:hypothetical protein